MNTLQLGILLLVGAFLALAIGLYLFFRSSGGFGGRGKFGVQRVSGGARSASIEEKQKSIDNFFELEEKRLRRDRGSTLKKKFRYANWEFPVQVYVLGALAFSLLYFTIASFGLNLLWKLVALILGPMTMGAILNKCVKMRSNKFDRDYAPFLLSVVGLLKTGMNPVQALEAAAQGLNHDSLVRAEVELMVERMRFGVPEDKSIGTFGETIYHGEIELFVQALLLSRKVGGTLSDTLERLARQVRRRQFFRMSAESAIGMQRGSIYVIIAILVALQVYMSFMYPEAVQGAIADPMGFQIWQYAIFTICLGIYWITQVTKIRV